MHRIQPLALAGILALLGAAGSVFAQAPAAAPRVAVFGFANETSSPSWDAAASAATDTLLLVLQQLGSYELLPLQPAAGKLSAEYLRSWAAGHGADYVIHGSMAEAAPGSVSCSLALFDRARGLESISRQSEAVDALGVFDAADELIAAVLNQATGRHIGFGRIAVEASGPTADYAVFLDGIPAGKNPKAIGPVLVGAHTLTVTQERMLGAATLAARTLEVAEGETATLSFSIPAILPEEEARLGGLEKAIAEGWDKPAGREEVEAAIAEYGRLSAGAPWSDEIGARHERSRQLGAAWIIRKDRAAIEEAAWEPRASLLDPAIAVALSAASYPDPAALAEATRGNAGLLAELLELRAGHALSKGDRAGALEAYAEALDLSRYIESEEQLEIADAAAKLRAITGTGKDAEEKLARLFRKQMEAGARFYARKGTSPLAAVLPPAEELAFGERPAAPKAAEKAAASAPSAPYRKGTILALRAGGIPSDNGGGMCYRGSLFADLLCERELSRNFYLAADLVWGGCGTYQLITGEDSLLGLFAGCGIKAGNPATGVELFATLYPAALTTFSSSINLHKIDLGFDLALRNNWRLSLGGTISGTAPASDTGQPNGAPYVAGFFAGLGIKL